MSCDIDRSVFWDSLKFAVKKDSDDIFCHCRKVWYSWLSTLKEHQYIIALYALFIIKHFKKLNVSDNNAPTTRKLIRARHQLFLVCDMYDDYQVIHFQWLATHMSLEKSICKINLQLAKIVVRPATWLRKGNRKEHIFQQHSTKTKQGKHQPLVWGPQPVWPAGPGPGGAI